MANVHLPVVPMEHHYLITEEIEQIANLADGHRLPHCIDFEANIYLRQESTGMLLGTYEPQSTPWSLDGTPQTFGHDLLEPDLDRIADRPHWVLQVLKTLSMVRLYFLQMVTQ